MTITDADNPASTATAQIVVLARFDICELDLQLSGQTFLVNPLTYNIGDADLSVQVPAFSSGSSGECRTYSAFRVTDQSGNESDLSAYDWITESDQRTWTPIAPYTVRFTQTGTISIIISTTSATSAGQYTINYAVWDGDASWASKDNSFGYDATPSLTLNVRDTR